jgi:guanine deaminase
MYGAVVAKDGEVLAVDHSHTWEKHDPSAHAEMSAIAAACKKINRHNIPGATLYASHEPCLMCFVCAAWAEIERIVFANPASANGSTYEFKDVNIFDMAAKLQRPMKVEHIEL